MPLVDGPDVPLWVSVTGAGSPVTVVAHGLSSSSSDLTELVDGLDGTRVSFDFRGHGRSAGGDGISYDQTAMTRDLSFVADRFGATHAVGVSMGAASILRLLCAQPARFAAICLVLPAWLDGDAPDREANAHLARMLERDGTAAVTDDVMATDAVRSLAPVWLERIRAQIRRMETPGMTRALREYPSGGAPVGDASLLRWIVAPALILAHDGDPGHPASVAHRLGGLLPNADVRVAPRPLAMLDDMRACGRSISTFFSTTTPTSLSSSPAMPLADARP
jgi:pimeloyl-ACP methyl ester carboxylesterase